MSILNRQTRSPRALSRDLGAEVADLYPSELRALVAGIAGTAPYLEGVLRREATWLAEAAGAPEEALAALPQTLAEAQAPAQALRLWKRRVAGLLALADLSGAYTLEEVTGALTNFADLAVATALAAATKPLVAQSKLPQAPGLTALAMGKMGAQELNYSSDIDLILLFDEARHDAPAEVRRHLVRAAQSAMKMLSSVTEDGYVFRTDLRLRPDPSVTPVVQGTTAAELYYESVGRTWERAAYIKARAIPAGEQAVGEAFLGDLRPFIWRRHLDFAAIQDVHDLRLKIRQHKGLYDQGLDGFDLKLGSGGIREIEFFAQNHQLIHGGREAALRARGTVAALARLAEAGHVTPEVAQTLSAVYRRHRRREHAQQMMRDAQTHTLPTNDTDWARLACLLDVDLEVLKAEVARDLEAVRDLCEPFFAPPSARVTAKTDDFGEEVSRQWPAYPALKSARAVAIFERLKPGILQGLSTALNPDQALREFDRFLRALPAGVQLFSLFDARPELVDLLVDICATAPALAAYLGRNAAVFDAVIDGAFFEPLAPVGPLGVELSAVLGAASDYETALNEVRRWAREQHFRIGVHLLRDLVRAEEAGAAYAALAEAVLAELWPHVVGAFAAKHGPPPGRGAVLLGMGSLGARKLHATSDLDLIVIYDADGQDSSVGPRPLATRPYYARLTQALITALTAQMPQGRLYEVDMRLRPSGRNGPVATSVQAFESYQRDEAWTWEHLALTRARVLAGAQDLADQVEAVRMSVLATSRDAPKIAADVADMRRRLQDARPGGGVLDIKDGAGGLQDLELFGQMLALLSGGEDRSLAGQLRLGLLAGLLSEGESGVARQAASLFWAVRSVAKLVAPEATDLASLGDGGTALAARMAGQASAEDLTRALRDAHLRSAETIAAVLERLA